MFRNRFILFCYTYYLLRYTVFAVRETSYINHKKHESSEDDIYYWESERIPPAHRRRMYNYRDTPENSFGTEIDTTEQSTTNYCSTSSDLKKTNSFYPDTTQSETNESDLTSEKISSSVEETAQQLSYNIEDEDDELEEEDGDEDELEDEKDEEDKLEEEDGDEDELEDEEDEEDKLEDEETTHGKNKQSLSNSDSRSQQKFSESYDKISRSSHTSYSHEMIEKKYETINSKNSKHSKKSRETSKTKNTDKSSLASTEGDEITKTKNFSKPISLYQDTSGRIEESTKSKNSETLGSISENKGYETTKRNSFNKHLSKSRQSSGKCSETANTKNMEESGNQLVDSSKVDDYIMNYSENSISKSSVMNISTSTNNSSVAPSTQHSASKDPSFHRLKTNNHIESSSKSGSTLGPLVGDGNRKSNNNGSPSCVNIDDLGYDGDFSLANEKSKSSEYCMTLSNKPSVSSMAKYETSDVSLESNPSDFLTTSNLTTQNFGDKSENHQGMTQLYYGKNNSFNNLKKKNRRKFSNYAHSSTGNENHQAKYTTSSKNLDNSEGGYSTIGDYDFSTKIPSSKGDESSVKIRNSTVISSELSETIKIDKKHEKLGKENKLPAVEALPTKPLNKISREIGKINNVPSSFVSSINMKMVRKNESTAESKPAGQIPNINSKQKKKSKIFNEGTTVSALFEESSERLPYKVASDEKFHLACFKKDSNQSVNSPFKKIKHSHRDIKNPNINTNTNEEYKKNINVAKEKTKANSFQNIEANYEKRGIAKDTANPNKKNFVKKQTDFKGSVESQIHSKKPPRPPKKENVKKSSGQENTNSLEPWSINNATEVYPTKQNDGQGMSLQNRQNLPSYKSIKSVTNSMSSLNTAVCLNVESHKDQHLTASRQGFETKTNVNTPSDKLENKIESEIVVPYARDDVKKDSMKPNLDDVIRDQSDSLKKQSPSGHYSDNFNEIEKADVNSNHKKRQQNSVNVTNVKKPVKSKINTSEKGTCKNNAMPIISENSLTKASNNILIDQVSLSKKNKVVDEGHSLHTITEILMKGKKIGSINSGEQSQENRKDLDETSKREQYPLPYDKNFAEFIPGKIYKNLLGVEGRKNELRNKKTVKYIRKPFDPFVCLHDDEKDDYKNKDIEEKQLEINHRSRETKFPVNVRNNDDLTHNYDLERNQLILDSTTKCQTRSLIGMGNIVDESNGNPNKGMHLNLGKVEKQSSNSLSSKLNSKGIHESDDKGNDENKFNKITEIPEILKNVDAKERHSKENILLRNKEKMLVEMKLETYEKLPKRPPEKTSRNDNNEVRKKKERGKNFSDNECEGTEKGMSVTPLPEEKETICSDNEYEGTEKERSVTPLPEVKETIFSDNEFEGTEKERSVKPLPEEKGKIFTDNECKGNEKKRSVKPLPEVKEKIFTDNECKGTEKERSVKPLPEEKGKISIAQKQHRNISPIGNIKNELDFGKLKLPKEIAPANEKHNIIKNELDFGKLKLPKENAPANQKHNIIKNELDFGKLKLPKENAPANQKHNIIKMRNSELVHTQKPLMLNVPKNKDGKNKQKLAMIEIPKNKTDIASTSKVDVELQKRNENYGPEYIIINQLKVSVMTSDLSDPKTFKSFNPQSTYKMPLKNDIREKFLGPKSSPISTNRKKLVTLYISHRKSFKNTVGKFTNLVTTEHPFIKWPHRLLCKLASGSKYFVERKMSYPTLPQFHDILQTFFLVYNTADTRKVRLPDGKNVTDKVRVCPVQQDDGINIYGQRVVRTGDFYIGAGLCDSSVFVFFEDPTYQGRSEKSAVDRLTMLRQFVNTPNSIPFTAPSKHEAIAKALLKITSTIKPPDLIVKAHVKFGTRDIGALRMG